MNKAQFDRAVPFVFAVVTALGVVIAAPDNSTARSSLPPTPTVTVTRTPRAQRAWTRHQRANALPSVLSATETETAVESETEEQSDGLSQSPEETVPAPIEIYEFGTNYSGFGRYYPRIVWRSEGSDWWRFRQRNLYGRRTSGSWSPDVNTAVQPFLQPVGGANGGVDRDVCGIFPAACAAPERSTERATETGARRTQTEAEVGVTRRHSGRTWELENAFVTVGLELGDDCTLTLVARGRRVAFATVDRPRCVARWETSPWQNRDGAAVLVEWNGDRVNQRAVIALSENGFYPEATVIQTVGDVTFAETRMVNLSLGQRQWTIGQDTVSLAPGETTHAGLRFDQSPVGAGSSAMSPRVMPTSPSLLGHNGR